MIWKFAKMIHRRGSLRTKLIVMINLVILFLVVSAALVMENRQRKAIISEVEKRALAMAKGLAAANTSELLTYNYVVMEQNVANFSREPDIAYVIILDKEGTVAAHNLRDDLLRTILSDEVSSNAAQAKDPLIQRYLLPGAERTAIYDVTVPVFVENSPEKWGMVRIGVSLQGMHREIVRTRWQIVGFGIVALIIGSLGSIVLARRIAKPLQQLTEGVAAVGRGDLNQRIEVATRDELGELASAFNEMTAQLVKARELEEKLKRSERLAALGFMAARIAHDIRNPLTSISIFCQLMAVNYMDPNIRAKFEHIVPRELDRVQAILEDMLEFARPSKLSPEPTGINEILIQALELYEDPAMQQGIEISKALTPDLPLTMVDRKKLHRCLSNIILNAIQAMPKGGRLSLATGLALEAELPPFSRGSPPTPQPALTITIADTGPGIPPDRLAHIFDPFYTAKEKGLGLGMAIAHRIIEDHGGTIDVESCVGSGTTFLVRLPIKPPISPDLSEAQPSARS